MLDLLTLMLSRPVNKKRNTKESLFFCLIFYLLFLFVQIVWVLDFCFHHTTSLPFVLSSFCNLSFLWLLCLFSCFAFLSASIDVFTFFSVSPVPFDVLLLLSHDGSLSSFFKLLIEFLQEIKSALSRSQVHEGSVDEVDDLLINNLKEKRETRQKEREQKPFLAWDTFDAGKANEKEKVETPNALKSTFYLSSSHCCLSWITPFFLFLSSFLTLTSLQNFSMTASQLLP